MARKGRHIQKWKNSAQEEVGISKNRAGRDKMESMHPKIGGQKGLAHTKMRQLRPDRVSTCKKGTIWSQKVSAHPKKE